MMAASAMPNVSWMDAVNLNEVMDEESFQPIFEDGGNFTFANLDNMQICLAPYETQAVTNWGREDCFRWAEQVCFQHNLDLYNAEHFSSVLGTDLLHYSRNDFCMATGYQNGHIFYEEFQSMLPSQETLLDNTAYSDSFSDSNAEYPCDDDLITEDLTELDQFVHENSSMILPDTFHKVDNHQHQMPPSPVIKIEEPFNLDESPCDTTPTEELEPCSCIALMKIGTNTRKRVRGLKNWEFLIKLLLDNSSNPAMIRWEDKAAYIFRLVNPTAIAKMWGKRSKKPKLSYDNFARGIRYHYKTGAMHPVSDKQLVYQCGPKAISFLHEHSRKSS